MLPLIALVLLLPTTWIVDAANGPGTNFTDLPPAVAAAASGDTIIVRAGTYTPFNVSGKALTIFGAGAGSSIVSIPSGAPYGETRIQGIPAGSTFYISGIRFAPMSYPPFGTTWSTAGLQILGSAGTVVLSGVEVFGATFPSSPANAGLIVSGGEVHASRCLFAGGSGYYVPGGPGAVVTGVIVAEASTFYGGPGTTQFAPGASALSLLGGVASLTRTSAIGGMGAGAAGSGVDVAASAFLRASGTSVDLFQGGAVLIDPGMTYGVPAVAVASGGSAILHGNITLVPGPTAPPTSGPVTVGATPLPYLAITGTSTADGDLLANQVVTVTLEDVLPFAPFVMVVDVAPDFTTAYAPLLVGELLVPLPPASLFEGALDALGRLQVTTIPSVVAPAIVGVPLYAQCGVLDSAAGNIRVSNGQIRRFQ